MGAELSGSLPAVCNSRGGRGCRCQTRRASGNASGGSSLTSLRVAPPEKVRHRELSRSPLALGGISGSPRSCCGSEPGTHPSFEAPLCSTLPFVPARVRTREEEKSTRIAALRIVEAGSGAGEPGRRVPGGGQAGLAAARLQQENVCLLIVSTKRLCAMLRGARHCPMSSGLEKRRHSPSSGFSSFGRGDFRETGLPELVLAEHSPTPAARMPTASLRSSPTSCALPRDTA